MSAPWSDFVRAVGADPLTVRKVNDLLGIDIWRVRSFAADVRFDFDEYGHILNVTLLNPDAPSPVGSVPEAEQPK